MGHKISLTIYILDFYSQSYGRLWAHVIDVSLKCNIQLIGKTTLYVCSLATNRANVQGPRNGSWAH